MQLPDRAWKELASAHGDCGHVPDALAGLAAPSESARQAARWKIDNHVVLQGDLYEGAPWVARELIDMLRRNDLPDRKLILDLLVELALGRDGGDSFLTPRGRVRVEFATKKVIAEGVAIFRAELSLGDPKASLLAQQIIDEVEEWEWDGVIAGDSMEPPAE